MALVPADPSDKKFWGIFYGGPGSGKTNIGTSYPKDWGTAAYIAVDNDAYRLEPVLPHYRDRLEVLRFDGGNPIDNLNEIAVHDWKKEGHGVLIVDTFSKAARKVLTYAAKVGLFPAKDRIIFGPKSAEITQGLPVPGDYGGAQHLVMNWVDVLFEHQRDMHIILLCHQDLYIPGKDAPAGTVARGGPATVGNAILETFPSEFPVVARLEVVNRTTPDGKATATYRVVTSMKGQYTARIREADLKGNPMPSYDLARDAGPWWTEFVNKIMKGDTK